MKLKNLNCKVFLLNNAGIKINWMIKNQKKVGLDRDIIKFFNKGQEYDIGENKITETFKKKYNQFYDNTNV